MTKGVASMAEIRHPAGQLEAFDLMIRRDGAPPWGILDRTLHPRAPLASALSRTIA
jgi:hypothetical protein